MSMNTETSHGDDLIQLTVTLHNGVGLLFKKPGPGPWRYPSGRVQKGLIISSNSHELVEEGVGLGLPIIRFGQVVFFPGDALVSTRRKDGRVITRVNYNLNLIICKTQKWGGTIENPHFYRIDEFFSRLHRRNPALRGVLTWASYPIKLLFGMNTGFRETDSAGLVSVKYDIDIIKGIIHISINLTGLKRDGCTGITIANEQGADHFGLYRDSNGLTLKGKEIGTWDESFAQQSSLVNSGDGMSFSINEVREARIFRGREVLTNRLAWSGLNYVLSGNTTDFCYDIKIGVAS